MLALADLLKFFGVIESLQPLVVDQSGGKSSQFSKMINDLKFGDKLVAQ